MAEDIATRNKVHNDQIPKLMRWATYASVAVATILQGAYKRKGFDNKGPVHLDKCHWKKTMALSL